MNRRYPPRGLFITGCDTDIGKTYVGALLAKSLVAAGQRVGVYKPVASGGTIVDGRCVCADAVRLWQAAGQPKSIEAVCPQMFLAPLAPHLAARKEGQQIDVDLLTSGLEAWSSACDLVIVEGVGGWMSPLAEDRYVADVAAAIGYPVLVVVPNRLGAINQALQTVLAVRSYAPAVTLAGLLVNDVESPPKHDDSRESNFDEIKVRVDVPLVARLSFEQGDLQPEVGWSELFGPSKQL